LPEVDHLLGSSDMLKLERVLSGGADRMLVGNPGRLGRRRDGPAARLDARSQRLREDRRGLQPHLFVLRHPGASRQAALPHEDDVVREVEALAQAGIVEVNLVSQDTVAFGRDREDGATLARLVRRVADVEGVHWVRLFYLYPEKLDDELIELLGDHPRVVPYVDMPLQHAADGMLRRMRRGHGGKRLYDLVERLRTRVERLTFRTAFIVGHPGETDAEFEELLAFVRFAEFDRVGVFRYSDEPSARSFALEDKVLRGVASKRAKKLMSVQRRISKKKNQALVGRELDVLVEGASERASLPWWVATRARRPTSTASPTSRAVPSFRARWCARASREPLTTISSPTSSKTHRDCSRPRRAARNRLLPCQRRSTRAPHAARTPLTIRCARRAENRSAPLRRENPQKARPPAPPSPPVAIGSRRAARLEDESKARTRLHSHHVPELHGVALEANDLEIVSTAPSSALAGEQGGPPVPGNRLGAGLDEAGQAEAIARADDRAHFGLAGGRQRQRGRITSNRQQGPLRAGIGAGRRKAMERKPSMRRASLFLQGISGKPHGY
jgi:hypothetical protein